MPTMNIPPEFAQTPEPPYYAVIFTSMRSADADGYGEMGEKMAELAATQAGYLGAESARDANGFGFTVSYWASEEAIANWRVNVEHLAAQGQGRWRGYTHYEVRVAKVERAYRWSYD